MSSEWSLTSTGNAPEGILSEQIYTEKAFDHEAARHWIDGTKYFSLWLSAIYVILIFAGQQWMSSRSPFDLRIPLFLWSSVLSVFSIIGTFRTVPELYSAVVNYGWTYSVCNSFFYHGSSGFWAFLFTMSKAYELGDTLFIVLRRQPLIFLHWYHHITVMLYTFYSYPEHVSAGRWYIVMNYIVHSFMYTYYALRAVRVPVPSLVRMSVTLLQILQMIIGLVVSVSVFINKRNGVKCDQSHFFINAAILMYGSYLVLFIHFFIQQYAVPARKKSTSNDKVSVEGVKKLH